MKTAKYALGLDFGTNSVRALVVDIGNGDEVGTAIFNYPSGRGRHPSRPKDAEPGPPEPGRLDPGHRERRVPPPLAEAKKKIKALRPRVHRRHRRRHDRLDSPPRRPRRASPWPSTRNSGRTSTPMAWLWKDHTGYAEAAEITALAAAEHPEYLAKCGGTYSSEWFFSKILHCLRTDPKVAAAAYSLGRMRRLHPGRPHRRSPIRPRSSAAAAPPATRPCSTTTGAACPAKEFLAKLDPQPRRAPRPPLRQDLHRPTSRPAG